MNLSSFSGTELLLKGNFLSASDPSRCDIVGGLILDDFYMLRLRQSIWASLRDKTIALSKAGGEEPSEEVLMAWVMKALVDQGGKQAIGNAVNAVHRTLSQKSDRNIFDCKTRVSRRVVDEAVVPIRDARSAWEQGIYEEVIAMTKENKRPFCIEMGPGKWTNPLIEKTFTMEYRESIRFLFDSEDLIETAIGIHSENVNATLADENMCPFLGMLKLPLETITSVQAGSKFPELSQQTCSHVGLDEGYAGFGNKFSHTRHEEGEVILKTGTLIDARVYLRRGVFPGQRARMWRLALGLAPEETSSEINSFDKLQQQTHCTDMITDELFIMDVLSTCDDPDFFIFEEMLRSLLLAFSRDDYVRENSLYEIHKKIDIAGDTSSPSGVQPYLGLAAYFAPLCYIYKWGASMYSVARESYCQLWCKLSVLSGDSGTLLHVCKTFENLLLETQPRLFLHLVNIGIQPLQIAFTWIQLAFVGILEVDQLMILWDRVIGYMDTNILGIFAASVFVYRADSLLVCTSATMAEKILSEHTRIKVIPLLQFFLLKGK